MTEEPGLQARGLVRTWSDLLRSRQPRDNVPRSSQNVLEGALCEEVAKEDALMSMLQQIMFR